MSVLRAFLHTLNASLELRFPSMVNKVSTECRSGCGGSRYCSFYIKYRIKPFENKVTITFFFRFLFELAVVGVTYRGWTLNLYGYTSLFYSPFLQRGTTFETFQLAFLEDVALSKKKKSRERNSKRLLHKKRICSQRSKFFLLTADPTKKEANMKMEVCCFP